MTEADLAVALQSGDVPVLATPRLVAWCEAATVAATAAHLGADETTVGMRVHVDHNAPSVVGSAVQISAVLTAVEGRRLVFDVEASAYWIEWYVSEARARGEEEVAPEAPPGDLAVAMSPWRGGERAFRRLLGTLGDVSYLNESIYFEGIDTPQGFFNRGEVLLEFSGDGTTESAEIFIVDAEGRRVTLEVAPLLDSVRFRYDQI